MCIYHDNSTAAQPICLPYYDMCILLRFGKIFFKAERKLTADELHAEFPVADVEKDGLINVSKLAIGSSHWTFVTA